MLKSIVGKEMTGQPHKQNWNSWSSRLTEDEMRVAKDAMNIYIDDLLSSNREKVFEASWIAGADWTNGPYQPIYYAANQDVEGAGYFFGLILWAILQERDEEWIFVDDQDRECKKYFLNKD